MQDDRALGRGIEVASMGHPYGTSRIVNVEWGNALPTHSREVKMANNPKAKLKTLYIMRILQDETDAEHGLSLRQIIERLDDYGIQAERKGIYRDIEALREFGLDIQTYQRNPVQYAIARRDFTLSELMLLVDAVESCRFLTTKQSRMLTTNLKLLASDGQRALLDRRIHVPERISSKNESVFGYIDLLHEAMRKHQKIEFVYFRYDVNGERYATRDGKKHVVTPVGISYSDGYYYLTAWNEDHESMSEYRIDRMGRMRISDDAADKNEHISRHSYAQDDHVRFGRFAGKPITATLLVDADKIEIIMDRFGKNAQIMRKSENTAKAVVKICKSEQFFGWIAGLGGTVRIDKPKSLKSEYKEYLLKLAEGIDD